MGKENCRPLGFARADKGRTTLTSAAITGDRQRRTLSVIFIPLGGPQAHDSPSRDDKVKG
jgi:hypothetical protein